MRHPLVVSLWKDAFQFLESKFRECYGGPVAQWITRLTTDQKIPGSNPGRFERFLSLILCSIFRLCTLVQNKDDSQRETQWLEPSSNIHPTFAITL